MTSINVLSPATALGLLCQLQQFFRLPGYIRSDSIAAFWSCSQSTVSRRLKAIDHHGLAVVRSEALEASKRWYWIDPLIIHSAHGEVAPWA